VPYVASSAEHPAARARLRLPGRWADWLAGGLAKEESELAVAIRPRRGDRVDVIAALVAVVVVVVASVTMEEAATRFGANAGLAAIVVGGLLLAAVTSLPNAVAAAHLASRGRGAATLSEAFNSNALNVIAGLQVPGAIVGLVRPTPDALFVALSCMALTAWATGLALRGRGLDRRAGCLIIVGYPRSPACWRRGRRAGQVPTRS
jgi:Ca2+/Na+ antiporter